MSHLSELESLSTEFHELRNAEYPDDESFSVAARRRRAIKSEIVEILEGLDVTDKSDDLMAHLEELKKDMYILAGRAVKDAQDRMNGVAKIPPSMSSDELQRIALEGSADDLKTLRELADLRVDEITLLEQLAINAADHRLNGVDVDPELFMAGLNGSGTHKIVQEFAGRYQWHGMDRYFMDGVNFAREVEERYPKAVDRWAYSDPRYFGMTAGDLNQLLGDPGVIVSDRTCEIAQKLFPEETREYVAVARERREALRTNWDVLTSDDISVIEAFLQQFARTYEPPSSEPKQLGPFKATTASSGVIARNQFGRDMVVQETHDNALTLASVDGGILVGAGCGAFLFDADGVLIKEIDAVRGRPVKLIDVCSDGRVAFLQNQQTVIMKPDLETVEHVIPGLALDDSAWCSWSPDGRYFGDLGIAILIYDTSTWDEIYSELRLEEEWRYTHVFEWISETEYLSTVSIQVGEFAKPKSMKTKRTNFAEGKDISRRGALEYAAIKNGELWAVARDSQEVCVYPASSSKFGWATKPSRSWRHTKSIYGISGHDEGVVIRTPDGVYLWQEAEPTKVAEYSEFATFIDGQLFVIQGGDVNRI